MDRPDTPWIFTNRAAVFVVIGLIVLASVLYLGSSATREITNNSQKVHSYSQAYLISQELYGVYAMMAPSSDVIPFLIESRMDEKFRSAILLANLQARYSEFLNEGALSREGFGMILREISLRSKPYYDLWQKSRIDRITEVLHNTTASKSS